MGHKIDQCGIRPLQDKLEENTKNIPKNEKGSDIHPGGNTILIEVYRNLSAQIDILQKLLKK